MPSADQYILRQAMLPDIELHHAFFIDLLTAFDTVGINSTNN